MTVLVKAFGCRHAYENCLTHSTNPAKRVRAWVKSGHQTGCARGGYLSATRCQSKRPLAKRESRSVDSTLALNHESTWMAGKGNLATLQPWQPGNKAPRRPADVSKAVRLVRKLAPEAVAFCARVLCDEGEETSLRIRGLAAAAPAATGTS
jgi:hypothetical protein